MLKEARKFAVMLALLFASCASSGSRMGAPAAIDAATGDRPLAAVMRRRPSPLPALSVSFRKEHPVVPPRYPRERTNVELARILDTQSASLLPGIHFKTPPRADLFESGPMQEFDPDDGWERWSQGHALDLLLRSARRTAKRSEEVKLMKARTIELFTDLLPRDARLLETGIGTIVEAELRVQVDRYRDPITAIFRFGDRVKLSSRMSRAGMRWRLPLPSKWQMQVTGKYAYLHRELSLGITFSRPVWRTLELGVTVGNALHASRFEPYESRFGGRERGIILYLSQIF